MIISFVYGIIVIMDITRITLNELIVFHFFSKTNLYYAGLRLEPLSSPQPKFQHGGKIFSNCSLLHKLLITGQGEQVVSRRGELNQDLLSSTCEYDSTSKVQSQSFRLATKFLTHTSLEQNNTQLAKLIIW